MCKEATIEKAQNGYILRYEDNEGYKVSVFPTWVVLVEFLAIIMDENQG